MLKKLLSLLKNLPLWLEILLIVLLILRIPSFLEPYYYGDEMIYLSLGEAIRQGKTLYLQIHDNKPPLLYLIAALAGSVFWFRIILAFWSLATVVIFWKLAEALFKKNVKLQKTATIIFGLITTLPLLEGNIPNAELFMIGPTMLALIILLTQKLNLKNIFGAGLLFSVSTLFKVPALFDIPAIVFLWLIVGGLKIKNLREIVKNTFYLALGYLIPIALTFVWYYYKGALSEYVIAAYLQNVGYLSTFRPGDIREPFIVRNLPLIIRGVLTATGIGIVTIFRKRLSKQFIFITIWLLLTLFAVTLSERPYPHYLIQSAPAVSLLFGMLFSLKTFEQSLTVLPLTLFFFIPYFYNYWRYPVTSYYYRFVNFTSGNLAKEEYFSSFDTNASRNYELANFITTTTKRTDNVFIWGDSSTIYALSRRLPPIKFVAGYHINDFSTKDIIADQLNSNKPKLIILLSDSPNFQEISLLLRNNYIQVEDIRGAQIWNLISPETIKSLPSYSF